jgi:hypothetical protein
MEVKNMNIRISHHAIEQFPKRVFSKADYNSTQIMDFLTKASLKGHYCTRRPGGTWDVRYDGVSIAVAKTSDKITVITVLGDRQYRNWTKVKEIRPRYAKRTA